MWGTDTKGSLQGWLTATTTGAATTTSPPIISSTSESTTTVSDPKHETIEAATYSTASSTTESPPTTTTATTTKTAATTTTTTFFSTTASQLDVPTRVDWKSKLPTSSSSSSLDSSNLTILQVVAGPTDTAMVLDDGTCYVCGDNKHGQLGLGHTRSVPTPTLLQLTDDDHTTTTTLKVQSISLGVNFSAAISTDGDLYTFGLGGSTFTGLGYLGHGNAESYHTPKLVESLVEDGCQVQQVQASECHMTVLTTEGEVLTCGAGSYGRLGNYDTVDQLYLEPVELLNKTHVTQIAGGKSFTLALDGGEGIVYGWGRNHKGQLGTGYGLAVDMYAMSAIPTPIEANELEGRRVTHIAAGHSHAACITESGELFTWGMTLHLEPFRVTELLHTKIVQVACGNDYTLALDERGELYSLGKGKTGVLGKGSIKVLHRPEVVEALQMTKVMSVSAGWSHVACLVEERTL